MTKKNNYRILNKHVRTSIALTHGERRQARRLVHRVMCRLHDCQNTRCFVDYLEGTTAHAIIIIGGLTDRTHAASQPLTIWSLLALAVGLAGLALVAAHVNNMVSLPLSLAALAIAWIGERASADVPRTIERIQLTEDC